LIAWKENQKGIVADVLRAVFAQLAEQGVDLVQEAEGRRVQLEEREHQRDRGELNEIAPAHPVARLDQHTGPRAVTESSTPTLHS